MYWPGAPRFLPTETEIPLLVDHNMERQVGVVHELFKLYWIDGGPWICARAPSPTLPSGLKRHETKASFGRWDIHSTPVGESLRVTSAFVKEVSLLIATEPNEPLAYVLSVGPTEKRIARASREPAPTSGGEVFPHPARCGHPPTDGRTHHRGALMGTLRRGHPHPQGWFTDARKEQPRLVRIYSAVPRTTSRGGSS